jgi:hypothetical protein
MVSLLVLTAAPDDALPLPVFASALVAAFRAELLAMLAAMTALLEAVVLLEVPLVLAMAAVTVPITALVV